MIHPVIAMLLLYSLSQTCCGDEYPVKKMLIEPAEVSKLAGHSLVILDVRGEAAYAAGHVIGAIRVDGNDWARNFQDGKDKNSWARRLGQLGLTPDSTVIIYDDAANKDAARIWWILKYWGLNDVRLLHGMWSGWKSADLPVSTEKVIVKPTEFKLAVQQKRLATKQDILETLAAKSAGIVDARTELEHTGKNKLNNKFGGCIPGAKNLNWEQLIDPKTSRFKTADELAALFAKSGIDLNQQQITHCQSGGRSSVMNFAMELMGARNIRNYHSSWGEWGNSDDVPIQTNNR